MRTNSVITNKTLPEKKQRKHAFLYVYAFHKDVVKSTGVKKVKISVKVIA